MKISWLHNDKTTKTTCGWGGGGGLSYQSTRQGTIQRNSSCCDGRDGGRLGKYYLLWMKCANTGMWWLGCFSLGLVPACLFMIMMICIFRRPRRPRFDWNELIWHDYWIKTRTAFRTHRPCGMRTFGTDNLYAHPYMEEKIASKQVATSSGAAER